MDMSRFDLPTAAIVGALVEGRDPTFLAAAFDVKTCFIKQLAIEYITTLLESDRTSRRSQHGRGHAPLTYFNALHALFVFLKKRRAAFSDILTTRELAEVAEVTSYLKVFATSSAKDHEYVGQAAPKVPCRHRAKEGAPA